MVPDCAMESIEFDATMGGTEHLPYSANSLKFAASRSVEIAAMTESILRPSKTKLIFQTLPVHMRRRVMSHNSKRLPRKLRQAHLEQLKKSGLPPKQKRPSRKYRRRPTNLMAEYNRRQQRIFWLETHIWHAKRFHMTEHWGYRLANAPCDKAFRACYRASSSHCLIQDISYWTPIQIKGPVDTIKDMFIFITNGSCGLSISAKAYITGNREGAIHLYEANKYPYSHIGKIHFVWVPGDSVNKILWLFVHPSQAKQVESVLTDLLSSNDKCDGYKTVEKRRKITNTFSEKVKMKVYPGTFNRFRLTGPNSHAILVQSLKCVDDILKIKTDDWVECYSHSELYLKEKHEYWNSLSSVCSPSQLPPKVIIGLIVRDPRLSRPKYRTKAKVESSDAVNVSTSVKIPLSAPTSPLWDLTIHETIKKKVMTNGQFVEHVTKTQLVPGEMNIDDPALQSVPVVLIQRPGSQDPMFKKVGYGSGWDIIIPSGYGLPFWLTFIMFGARSGGLRETKSLAFEMGECYLSPDSDAGKVEEKRIETKMREKYFRLPPSKRVNYIKLGIITPFTSPWKILLKDWCDKSVNDFFVLRDRRLLDDLQDCINKTKDIPQVENAYLCLTAVYLRLTSKGNLKRHALICMPKPGDVTNVKKLFEPHHEDLNEPIRKKERTEHMKLMKQLRKKRIKLKKKGKTYLKKSQIQNKSEPSDYMKSMRNLWLPSDIRSVRHIGSREVLGYVSHGAFSFSEARSCGVGYIAYNALSHLLNSGLNQVLVRNTSSRKYRLANIQIIKNI